MKVQDVYKQLKDNPQAILVDVRELNEWQVGHAEMAVHYPLSSLPEQFLADYPAVSGTVFVICRSGGRSTVARDLLKKQGITQVVSVDGGTLAWQEAQLPMTKN